MNANAIRWLGKGPATTGYPLPGEPASPRADVARVVRRALAARTDNALLVAAAYVAREMPDSASMLAALRRCDRAAVRAALEVL